jgi:multidrug efflux system outer membrane protein
MRAQRYAVPWAAASLAAATVCAVVPPADADEQALTLTQALAMGRRRAPSLRAARAHAASTEANVDEQAAAYYPTLSATLTAAGTGTRDTQPAPAGGLFAYVDYSGAFTGATSVRWTLYDFGRTAGNVASAEAGRASAAASAASTALGVENDVANAYCNFYYKEELRHVAEDTLVEREKLVDLAKGLVKAGLQPPLEEIRAAARAEQARLTLANASADRDDARAQLATLLGLDPRSRPTVAAPRLPPVRIDLDSAQRSAEELPSVASAYADYHSKEATASNAAARYLPVVSLAIDDSYVFTRHDSNRLFLDTRRASGSLVVSVPIFDASIAPNLAGARYDAVAASAVAEQAKRDARGEAVRATLAARATAVALEHARLAADGAATVLAVVKGRYLQGLSSPLELIDAESSDADARTARAQAELAQTLAVIRVLTAIGRPIVETPSAGVTP